MHSQENTHNGLQEKKNKIAQPGSSLDAEKRGGLSGKFDGGASDLDRQAQLILLY